MLALAVLAERLAVVGEHGDERSLEETPRPQRLEKPAHLRVHVGHLAVVGARPELPRPKGAGGS